MSVGFNKRMVPAEVCKVAIRSAPNMFVTYRQWCTWKFDTPFAFRMIEVAGRSGGDKTDFRECVGNLLPSRITDIDEVEVQGPEALVGPYTDAGATDENHVDSTRGQRLYDQGCGFRPPKSAD